MSQSEAEQIFADSRLLILADEKHSDKEIRFHAYGQTGFGRRLVVCFTVWHDATVIRVISAREMSRKERGRYEQEA